MKESQQRKALLEHKKITGHTWTQIAQQINTPLRTVHDWTAGRNNPPHCLPMALENIRAKLAANLTKGKKLKAPSCPLCGEDIELNEVRRGFFVGSHRCLSGVVVKIPARPMDEVLRGLTPVVAE